jgi:pimeloyl-ACP methyl ester carboxylesterase
VTGTAELAEIAVYEAPDGRLVPAGEYELFVSEHGDPDGFPLILLHGGPGVSGWTNFGPTMPHLVSSGRRMLVVDLLQYGRSSKPKYTGPQWQWHAEYLVKMMDSLGIAQADFACNSGGGCAALCLAADYPDRARRLVITGSQPMELGNDPTSPEFQSAGKQANQRYFAGTGPTWDKAKALMAEFEWHDARRITDEAVDLRLEESRRPDLLELGGGRDVRGYNEDLESRLRTITAPILFLWGRYDQFVVQSYPLLLADTVANGDVYIMDDVGHHPSEERPAEYAAMVLAFLGRDQPAA